jgi:DNA-binding NarL/FixJ family response regulator
MKKRVLLIDDNDEFLELMTPFIEVNSDFEVIPSKWPELAEQMIVQYQPFAVVTDTNMDRLNGIELLVQIKKSRPELPVIVLFSGLQTNPSIQVHDVRSLGADGVMSKIAAMQELVPLLVSIARQAVAGPM